MAFWLMKSEPSAYAWSRLVAEGGTRWDGVRNHQANNNMKAMQVGDHAFFYHSNEGREVVGIMAITTPWSPDPADASGHFGCVTVAPVRPLPHPVSLSVLKADPVLAGMALIRQSRLSVSPVTATEWQRLCALGEVREG